jgi:hypothetical protein
MPHFKTENLGYIDHERTQPLKIKISINADGEFYCDPPEELSLFFKPSSEFLRDYRSVRVGIMRGRTKLISSNYTDLKKALSTALAQHLEPTIESETVIRFNIESHIMFAIGDDGELYPNCYYPGTRWPDRSLEDRFGRHHAQAPARGGYSLSIGAVALTKTTKTYGTIKKVTYKPYYKGESHLGNDNPAQKLNSWCGISIPEGAREIPYTDEAALFFYDLMMGMARLSKMIQDHTFETESLLQLIENSKGTALLGGPIGKSLGR